MPTTTSMAIVGAILGVAVVVGISIWMWQRYRGVTIADAAQVIVDFLRGLFGG
jgi:phosphate/sulfate permease